MKQTVVIDHIQVKRSKHFCLTLENITIGSEIVCIAGPNGSGKTTLLECLTGLIKGPNITVTVCGQELNNNMRAVKALLGYIPDDENWLIAELSATEYFELLINIYARLDIPRQKMEYRVKRLSQLLHFKQAEQQLGSLSHGNKKKVQIVAALLHQPKILIVDELRNGLDPLAIIAAENIIRTEAASGTCVIASTHDLWWAERISAKTLLLVDGKVALYESTDQLLEAYGSLEKLFLKVTAKDVLRATL